VTTLLAIDDSNTMRRVLEITFAGEEDLEVVLASGANEALGLLGERRPSLVLVDVTLGAVDGYALCQQIKQASPRTPVVILSSKQNPYDPSRGSACGADDHVDKPFDTQALIERVRGILERAPVAFEPAAAAYVEPVTAPPAPHVEEPVYQPEPVLVVEPELEPEPLPPPQLVPIHEPEPVAPPQVAATPVAAVAVAPVAVPPVAAAPVAAAPVAAPPPVALRAAAEPSHAGGNGLSAMKGRLGELGLTEAQVAGVLALSREVIEQAVWEVVPTLAETLIREEIARLTRE
jgi:CheY-like chemotaxis protein